MMTLLTLTIAAFAIVMLIMAVGVIFNRKCLRGSCGGPEIFDADGDPVSCGACPRRKDHERYDTTGHFRPAPACLEAREENEEHGELVEASPAKPLR